MKFSQYDLFILTEDLGGEIKKGMRGVVLEVFDDGAAYEVEFVKEDGSNHVIGNQVTFTLSEKQMQPMLPD